MRADNGRVYSVTSGDRFSSSIKNGDRVREVQVPYYGGLRYPRLEKIGTAEGGLDMLLKAK